MKRLIPLLALLAALLLCLTAAAASDESGVTTAEPASGEASSEEPALPLVPGTYESGDGAVLKIAEDGTCTFATQASGVVDGREMSGRLTFRGVYAEGRFSFDRVTYLGIDITDEAAAAGYTDGSQWEQEALSLYAASLAAASGEADSAESPAPTPAPTSEASPLSLLASLFGA